ncbi:MAG: electron transport complex subunit RsxC, partial [Gammaproteobacteria bacterium]|nr:electron transport complex subunit RsxC [Gammaproteobacteria bacterium]
MSRALHSFHGGLHLDGHKAESTARPLETMPVAKRLVLPLLQHIGVPAHPLVEAGQTVRKGEVIARAEGAVSTNLHAPTSGKVIAIEDHAVPHVSGLPAPCIILEADGRDEWGEKHALEEEVDAATLRQHIQDAGIVGLGGAGFPAHIKLNPGEHQVETLILNGAECEPYITCDDMLMRERPQHIVRGILLMQHALQAKHLIIAIEDNKPEALAAIGKAVEELAAPVEVVAVPTLYPTGGERQLIKVLTGKEVPSQGLPLAIDVVCHNVATAASVYKAVVEGEPLISRVVTVTGSAVEAPRNLEVAFGTPMREVLDYAGVDPDALGELVMGGPMMGLPIPKLDSPVIKTTNCLLTTARRELEPHPQALPCIRCGACADVCPAQLLPQQLYWHARAKAYDRVQDFHLFDCIECGCCDYVCPSSIPLVQYYRFAKTEIWEQEREKKKADIARERHEFR